MNGNYPTPLGKQAAQVTAGPAEGSVGYALQALEKQICATKEVMESLCSRIEGVLIPADTLPPPNGFGVTVDSPTCPLASAVFALEARLASLRHGLESTLQRINL